MKSNKKTPFHRKNSHFFANDIELLTIGSDLGQFQQILCFAKIECSIIP